MSFWREIEERFKIMKGSVTEVHGVEVSRRCAERLRFSEGFCHRLSFCELYVQKDMRKYSEFDGLTSNIIGCAIEVHRHLGPGLLESTYQKCLIYELKEKGLSLQSEIGLPIIYKKIKMEHGYRIDILVENTVVLELKTVEFVSPVHSAQILTYMTLGKHPVGYLLNFHVKLLKEGIKRFVL